MRAIVPKALVSYPRYVTLYMLSICPGFICQKQL